MKGRWREGGGLGGLESWGWGWSCGGRKKKEEGWDRWRREVWEDKEDENLRWFWILIIG